MDNSTSTGVVGLLILLLVLLLTTLSPLFGITIPKSVATVKIRGVIQVLHNAFLWKGAVQVLRNADGGGGVSDFPEKSVTKV